ncbi:MAG: twitching motility protein PilT [Lysobacteraceae bacterium]|nr:MAG: twitching motility protein PilT [Xanthomonadaceae bacterium]
MVTATFRFYDSLGDFLPRERRGRMFSTACARDATTKHMIEALGVPHTEVALLLVNGEPSGFERPLREGDRVAVYPAFGQLALRPLQCLRAWPDGRLRFVADAHLGGLARLLRMAGYDTLYDNGYHDDEIERIAREEGRVLLTRDRALLMRRSVELGCYPHALDPPAQLRELFVRLRLGAGMRPFSLCLHCNAPLRPVVKAEVLDRLPPRVAASHDQFTTCDQCGRVYWKGSHHARMQGLLEDVAAPPADVKLPPTPDSHP